MEMEMSNINKDKHDENRDLMSDDHSRDEKEHAEAIDSIFYNPHHEFFDRAGEIDSRSDNKTNGVDDYSARHHFDVRSEFGGPMSESIPDVNAYQHKKTVAQGMMDIALFSANANQLRYVLENKNHPYYYPGLLLISISLIFQVVVGVGLLLNTRYNVKSEKEICIANKINNFTVVGIFLVTVINVFISAFGVATTGGGIGVAIPVSFVPRFGGNRTTFGNEMWNATLWNGTLYNITASGNLTDTDMFAIFANFTQS